MWVFTQNGFVSVVNHDRDDEKLTVRARDIESLQDLAEMSGEPIESTPYRDYEHRIFVDREVYADWLTYHVDSLDYSNFKNRVGDTLGPQWYHACSHVWEAMLDISDTHKVRDLSALAEEGESLYL